MMFSKSASVALTTLALSAGSSACASSDRTPRLPVVEALCPSAMESRLWREDLTYKDATDPLSLRAALGVYAPEFVERCTSFEDCMASSTRPRDDFDKLRYAHWLALFDEPSFAAGGKYEGYRVILEWDPGNDILIRITKYLGRTFLVVKVHEGLEYQEGSLRWKRMQELSEREWVLADEFMKRQGFWQLPASIPPKQPPEGIAAADGHLRTKLEGVTENGHHVVSADRSDPQRPELMPAIEAIERYFLRLARCADGKEQDLPL